MLLPSLIAATNSSLVNITIPITTTTLEEPTSGNHQFTRLNIIGTFLALQLCQLTQPYGSLLFRGYGGGFWRCNPLASFTEACIIFWHLGLTAIQSRHQNWGTVLQGLQATSAGLLLLRASAGENDLSDSTERLVSGSQPHVQTTTETLQDSMALGETVGATRTDSSSLDVSTQAPNPDATGAVDSTSANKQLLSKAFDANALAHKEFRIDILTAFTELITLLKLVAVRGCGWFTTAGMFLIFGWFSVQILLLLFHHQEMNDAKTAVAVEAVGALKCQLREQSNHWLILLVLLHLPFFGYPAYLAAFRPWISEDATGFAYFIKDAGWRITFAIMVMGGGMVTLWGLPVLIMHLLDDQHEYVIMFSVFFTSLSTSLWFMSAILSSSQQACVKAVSPTNPDYSNCIGNSTTFFKPDTFLYYTVDRSFEFLCKAAWLVVFMALILLCYLIVTISPEILPKSWSHHSFPVRMGGSSLGNAIFILIVFILYLFWYDDANTYKPTWVDVLG